MQTLDHNPDVRALVVDGRLVAYYTSSTEGDARRCNGHRTDNTAGYVVRRTLDNDGQLISNPDSPGGVGVDVFAVACRPGWGNYDKALSAARALRSGKSYAVIDTLYRCGHRSGR